MNITSPEIVDYAQFSTPQAWIGYDRQAFARGELVIDVCVECEGLLLAEAQVRQLKCKIFRTLCSKHIAERTARMIGEKL